MNFQLTPTRQTTIKCVSVNINLGVALRSCCPHICLNYGHFMSHFACLDYCHCLLIQFSDLMHYELLEVWIVLSHLRLDTRVGEALLNEQQKVDG